MWYGPYNNHVTSFSGESKETANHVIWRLIQLMLMPGVQKQILETLMTEKLKLLVF